MLKTNFWNSLFKETKHRLWSVQLVPQRKFFFSSDNNGETLPGKEDRSHNMNMLKSQMTPKQIINYLNQYIIGQEEAKKAVAMALRNRWRRRCLDEDLKKEVYPKNILMVGPTGCGKTEIARRIAKMTNAPFIKVEEATKYTEIGYHGQNVDQVIIDLLKSTIKDAEKGLQEEFDRRESELDEIIIRQLLHSLLGPNMDNEELVKQKLARIREGYFDERYVTFHFPEPVHTSINSLDDYFNFLRNYAPAYKDGFLKKTTKIKNAKKTLKKYYSSRVWRDIDIEQYAINKVQEEGVVFIDEIDKIADAENAITYGRSPSSDGVQRDFLPIIEGTTVNTKYGDVKTDHILFIAGGAFSKTKPTDLMPELLGRLPIRVELKPLRKNELKRILVEPKYNLIMQQKELLKTEDIEIEFTEDSLEALAALAEELNLTLENLGARRLHSMIEKLVEDYSFEGPDLENKAIVITPETVNHKLKQFKDKTDISRYLI